jgi:general transcriptional corepressor CYC8
MALQPGGPYAHVPAGAAPVDAHLQRQRLLAQLNESTWQRIGTIGSILMFYTMLMLLGTLNEMHNALDDALFAYEQALRHNLYSTQTLNAISTILRTKEQYQEAMEYLRNIIKMEPANGEAWGNLGHCHLMMDNLQEAYTAYQQALYYLPDPKVCRLGP